MQCFSVQVEMNKCVLLNLEKNLAQIHLAFSRKIQKTHTLILKNDVIEPKAGRLDYSIISS